MLFGPLHGALLWSATGFPAAQPIMKMNPQIRSNLSEPGARSPENYEHLRTLLIRWGQRRHWDPDFTDEVAQRTLEEWLFRDFPATIPPPRKLWLRALSHAKRVLHERLTGVGDRIQDLADTHHPEALLERQDLDHCLGSMPSQQRRILEMIYLQGWSRAEASTALSLSAQTLRVQLHRAREHLLEAMERDSLGSREDFL